MTLSLRALGIKERGSWWGWGNAGLVGGGEPHGAVQTVRKAGKGRLWGALWFSPTEMLCAWQMRPALLPGLAGKLLIELAQCRHLRSETTGAFPLEDSYVDGPLTRQSLYF